MKIIKPLLVCVIISTLSLGLCASSVRIDGAEVGEWTMDYESALELAADKNLPVLLNFTGSDWCIWCKRMDAQVFAKDAWQNYASENIVLVTLDFPRDKGIVPSKLKIRNNQLKQQFGVRGYPTYIILESDGKTRLGQLGAGTEKTPDSFIKEIEGLMKMSSSYLEELQKKNPAKAEAMKAAIDELREARKALDDWIATRPPRNPENEKLYKGFLKRIEVADKALQAY